MSMVQRVSDELKTAMKARDKVKVATLRGIRAAFIEAMKADGSETVSEEQSATILRRLAKQRKKSIDAFVKGGREELAEGERAELAVLGRFLPKQADAATTEAWVVAAIEETGASSMRDMGKVMGVLMRDHKAELDAGMANKLVKARLA